VNLPHTLHGQLFLLGFDRRKGRLDLDNQWRFGLALRAAMLTDLYRSGHLENRDGCPRRVETAPPADHLLRSMLGELTNRARSWAQLIMQGQRETAEEVRRQLESDGWLQARPRRRLGVIPVSRLDLRDDDVVDALAGRVGSTLRLAIDGRPADERLLALALLCVLGQFPAGLGIDELSRHQKTLMTLIERAAPSIRGLAEAITTVHAAMDGKRQEAASHAT
jgi:hypothetical protein